MTMLIDQKYYFAPVRRLSNLISAHEGSLIIGPNCLYFVPVRNLFTPAFLMRSFAWVAAVSGIPYSPGRVREFWAYMRWSFPAERQDDVLQGSGLGRLSPGDQFEDWMERTKGFGQGRPPAAARIEKESVVSARFIRRQQLTIRERRGSWLLHFLVNEDNFVSSSLKRYEYPLQ